MAKSSGRQKRFVDDAALQALVRFQPQLDVLKQAQNEAKSQYLGSVSGANAGRVAVQQAVDAARPGLAQAYDQSGLAAAQASQTLIGHDLAGLGNVADSIKAGAALEAAGMTGNLASARAAALGGLADRRVQAATGAVTAKHQARSELATNLARILQSQQDILGQRGTFEASALSDLQNQDIDRTLRSSLNRADNAQSERNSERSAGLDPDTGKPIPGGKLDRKPKKPRMATAAATARISDAVSTALQVVKDAKSDGASREDIMHDLTVGVSPQTFTVDPRTGKKLRVPVHDPGVPRMNPLVAQIATELAYDGSLSQDTVDRLHRRRVKVRSLGYRTRASLSPTQQATITGTQNLSDFFGSL